MKKQIIDLFLRGELKLESPSVERIIKNSGDPAVYQFLRAQVIGKNSELLELMEFSQSISKTNHSQYGALLSTIAWSKNPRTRKEVSIELQSLIATEDPKDPSWEFLSLLFGYEWFDIFVKREIVLKIEEFENQNQPAPI